MFLYLINLKKRNSDRITVIVFTVSLETNLTRHGAIKYRQEKIFIALLCCAVCNCLQCRTGKGIVKGGVEEGERKEGGGERVAHPWETALIPTHGHLEDISRIQYCTIEFFLSHFRKKKKRVQFRD
jgi:hypothetical protein